MKQIHLRLDDNDYDKLAKEAAFYNVSLNKYITNRALNNTDSPTKEAPPQPSSPKTSITEIHKDLTNILIEINSLKTKILDSIYSHNKSDNLSVAEQSLAKSITEAKQDILKQLLVIQKKISKIPRN